MFFRFLFNALANVVKGHELRGEVWVLGGSYLSQMTFSSNNVLELSFLISKVGAITPALFTSKGFYGYLVRQ